MSLTNYLRQIRIRKTIILTALFFVIIPSENSSAQDTTSADSKESVILISQNVRGVERERRSADYTLRKAIVKGLYLPREVVRGILLSTGKSVIIISEDNFIARAEDFFSFLIRKSDGTPVYYCLPASLHTTDCIYSIGMTVKASF